MKTESKSEKEKAQARAIAREIGSDILKIEKYLESYLQGDCFPLSPRAKEQLRRAKEAVYALRVCLHYESCKF